MDCARDFASGAGDLAGEEGDGCLNGGLDATIDLAGATNQLNLGGANVRGTASGAGPDPIVIRIRAHKEWTGYISEIVITWSGS